MVNILLNLLRNPKSVYVALRSYDKNANPDLDYKSYPRKSTLLWKRESIWGCHNRIPIFFLYL